MPEGGYSAGSIFLQVVPVFGDVQRAIERKAKDIDKALGDEMEKAGKNAGERAGKGIGDGIKKGVDDSTDEAIGEFQKRFDRGIANIQKSLKPLDIRLEGSGIKDQFKEIHKDLDALQKRSEKGFVYEADIRDAEAKLRILAAQLAGLENDVKITAKLDVANAAKAAADLEKTFDRLRRDVEITARFEGKQAERALGEFEKKVRGAAKRAADALGSSMDSEIRDIKTKLERISESEIGIDIDAEDAKRQIEDLTVRARRLSLTSSNIEVKVDAARAAAELSGVLAAVRLLDGKDVDINVDTKGAAAAVGIFGALRAAFTAGGSGADGAANSFRSFNAIILAIVTILPALIPIIGAVGGALLGMIPILAAVGAGFSTMLIGFSGIGDAVGALGDQADNAAKDTSAAASTIKAASYAVVDAKRALADAVRNAARAEEDAARATAKARESAAEAIADAIDRQKRAQEDYRDSIQAVKDAEKALADARKQAAADAESTDDKIRQNALDIRQAQLNAFDATNNLNSVMADGSSTAYDKESASIGYEQAQEALHELREEAAALAEEKAKQDKDGVDGSDKVKNAQEALLDAIKDQKDALKDLRDANDDVRDARIEGAERIADAVRAQNRAEVDGARNVARAQEALRRAQEGYGDALAKTGDIGSASMQKVELAMGKLSPAGRKFAIFLLGLRQQFGLLRAGIQEVLLPSVQSALETLINTYGPRFYLFMLKMSAVTGQFFEKLAASLTGPAWSRFFATMDALAPRMAEAFGGATLSFFEGIAGLLNAAAPFAVILAEGIADLMGSFANWANSEEGQQGIVDFLTYVQQIGPDVIAFFKALVGAVVNIGIALAPLGDIFLNVFTSILNFIAEMDPKTLGVITGAIIALIIAFQVAVGLIALFAGGAALAAIPGGKFVFFIISLIINLGVLAARFEFVRDIIGFVVDRIQAMSGTIMFFLKVIGYAILALRTYRLVMTVINALLVGGAIYNAVLAKAVLIYARAQAIANLAAKNFPLIRIIAIILLVVAALVLLYKKNAKFRAIVQGAWQGLRKAGEVAFRAIVVALGWIADKAEDLWKSLQPTFKDIGTVFTFIWQKVILPILKAWLTYWTFVFKALQFAWQNILWPVFKAIGVAVGLLWSGLKFYFGLLLSYFTFVFKSMKLVWDQVLHPVFKAIWAVVKFLWEKVFSPLLGKIGDLFARMGRGFKKIYDTVIAPMFTALKNTVSGLKSVFETAVEGIKSVWSKIIKIIGKPIRWLINTVLVDGLFKGIDKVLGFVGAKQLNVSKVEWSELDAKKTGGIISGPQYGKGAYATGGVLPGYTPGVDVHKFTSPTGGRLHLSGGEAIMRPEFTAVMGKGWVDQMNAAARAGGRHGVAQALGGHQAYAFGGIYSPLPGARISRHTSGYRGYAADYNVGSGSDDLGLPVHAYREGIIAAMRYIGNQSYGRWMDINHPGGSSSRYAHLQGFAKGLRPGMGIKGNQVLGYVGGVGNASSPHLHFEINGGGATPPASFGEPHKTGGGGGFPKWIIEVAKGPIKYATGLMKGIKNITGKFGDNELTQGLLKLPGKFADKVGHKIWDVLPGPLKDIAGGAAKVFGTAGDIAGNIADGVGNVAGAIGDGLGFRDGGVLPYNGTMMYDQGGYLPPGITNVVNLTGKPEPVFTDDQFRGMTRTPDGKGGWTYAPTFNGTDLTAADVVEDMEFAHRKMKRSSSKYEGD